MTITLTQDKINSLWEKYGGDNLLDDKSFQDLFKSLPDKGKAFVLQDYHLRCIDEGTVGGVHLAGSGILYERATEDLKGKTDGITSHEGCGAAALYVKENNIQTENPDLVGEEKAKELAENLNVGYLGMIKAQDLARPKDLHTARAIYYDGSGHFNPTQANGMPLGFVISRKLIKDIEHAKKELQIAINIVLGDHGFGQKFTPSTPLYIVAVSDSEIGSIDTQTLLAEINEVVAGSQNVKVDNLYHDIAEGN